MNIRVFSILRGINRHIKRIRRERAGEIMSPVRRIEFVSPPKERVCAMTFDDGPTAAPCLPTGGTVSPGAAPGLTARLLDVLKQHGATATFDVVGTTAENYPDVKGAPHTHFVFGTKYDHYACFEQDALAGALAQPALIRRMVEEGHEIANHGYRHRIFGPEYFVYRKRVFQKNLGEVTADLQKLHDLIKEISGYEIKLARPPHYVDRIGRFGRDTAYTAFARMGYQYMAASADGGGWFPTKGDYDADVRAMVSPLEEMLKRDPESLNGKIIFQKDGYNMSMQSPVADALGLQLKLLGEYGYRVVGVEELTRLSPFEDVARDDPCIEAVRGLDSAGYAIGFKNNTFKPNDPVTEEQLAAMCTPRREYNAKRRAVRQVMQPEEIRRFIAERFGDCGAVRGTARRDAVMAAWAIIRERGSSKSMI
ncbi:MAG: polysaccharide deacetylase family protein [Clostridiales bacterium]|jgi:peptidoglycan/xylan/chitin deacetylase (PgdA/CDA1 family)|nr:polysaccharide deacetylase family protein [Clostridiales bacterium]